MSSLTKKWCALKEDDKSFVKQAFIAFLLIFMMISAVFVTAYMSSKDIEKNLLTINWNPRVYIQWEDSEPADFVSDVVYHNTGINYNNVATVRDADGNELQIPIFAAANLNTASNPYPYIYLPDTYTLDELKSYFCGKPMSVHGYNYEKNKYKFEFDCANVCDIYRAADQDSLSQHFVKYYFVNTWTVTEVNKSQLKFLDDIEPFHPERKGKTFIGWTPAEFMYKDAQGNEHYRTQSRYVYAEEDKEVTVLWKDSQTNGDYALFNRIGWANGKLTLTHPDGTEEEWKCYNVGNDGTVAVPAAYVFLPSDYSVEYWQDKLIGAEAEFVNTAVEVNGGFIKDITLNANPNEVNGYLKYDIYLSVWPETIVPVKYLSQLRDVSPYTPYREGWHFDGWSTPTEIKEDYFVTYAQWSLITDDPNDMTLTAYCAKYGNVLVFGRGSVPDNYEGIPLDVYWDDVERMSGDNCPWLDYADQIKEVDFVGKIQPDSTNSWFEGMSNLAKISNGSNFDFTNVEDYRDMFKGCRELTSLNLAGIDSSNVKHTDSMFEGCTKLTRIYVNESWQNTSIESSDKMFDGCILLRGGNKFKYSPTFTNKNAAVIDSDMNPGYLTAKAPEAYAAIYGVQKNATEYTLVFGRGEVAKTYGDLKLYDSYTGIEEENYESNTIPWKKYRDKIVNVEFLDVISPVSTSYWFNGFVRIDTVDLSKLDTSNTLDMTMMFANCLNMTSIDVSSLDVSSVQWFSGLFYYCQALTEVDLSSWDTGSAIGMGQMFWECQGLENVNFGDNYNTENVLRLNGMFFHCLSLVEVDISSFDTRNCLQISQMFQDCFKLTTIYAGYNTVPNSVNIENEAMYNRVFTSNSKLVGGNGTSFKDTSTDSNGTFFYAGVEYFWIDGRDGKAGYFTLSPRFTEFTITYNANGGTNAPAIQTGLQGSEFTLSEPGDMNRANHEFKGWATSASGDVVYNPGDVITPTENMILYAVWEFNGEVDPDDDAIDRLIENMTLRERVCQMFNVYVDSIANSASTSSSQKTLTASQLLNLSSTNYPYGGVTYFKGNIEGGEAQAIKLSEDLQAASKIPMCIAVDEEGGRVQRIGGTTYDGTERGVGIGYQLNAMQTYASGGVEVAKSNAYKLADNCLRIGCNWDFAPVADTNSNPSNPIIGARAYSTDYQETATLISSAIDGFHNVGGEGHYVMTSIKHFPGHGDTGTDTHYGSASVDKSYEELQSQDLIPFAAGIDAGTDSVMIGHLTIPQIDSKFATVSEVLIQDVLRGDMGFEGVIVTDGMRMGAVTKEYGTTNAGYYNAVRACLDAGIDVFLLPGNPEYCVQQLEKDIAAGDITESRINESVKRILIMKKNAGLLDEVLADYQ